MLAKKKTHPLASYVKARLLMTAGDEEAALKLLQDAVDPKSPEPKVLEALGKRQGDDGYQAALDANGDGQIDGLDLAGLRFDRVESRLVT